jgi:hypothetical protein
MPSADVEAHPEITRRLDASVDPNPSPGTLRSTLGPVRSPHTCIPSSCVHSEVSGLTRERLTMAASGDLSDRSERTDLESSATRYTSRRIDLALPGLPRRGSHLLTAFTTQLMALGVLELFAPRQGAWRDAHAVAALQALRGAASIEHWHTALAVDGPNARSTRSILLDPQFVLESAALRDVRRTLAGHSEHIDAPALRAYLLAHYGDRDRCLSKQLADWCERALEVFVDARLRMLANSLYHARFLEEQGADPRVRLPAAAKAGFDAVRTPEGPRRRVRQGAERCTHLPLLDQFTQRRQPTPAALRARPAQGRRHRSASRGSAPDFKARAMTQTGRYLA